MSLENDLVHFSGSENFYEDPLTRVIYTDGVKYFAEHGEAYWAVTDMICRCTVKFMQKHDNFIVFKIKSDNNKAKMTITDGNYDIIEVVDYEFTDLEQGEYKFFAIYDGVRTTLLLPGEY